MTSLRAFLGVPVSDSVRAVLVERVASLSSRPRGRAVRWVRPEGYHVTLRFLGEIDGERVPALARAVAAEVEGCARFALGLGALRLFPSSRRPRVIVADLRPAAPLAALARRVECGVVACGFPPDARRFRAHLTLGRIRDRVHPRLPEEALQTRPFEVTEVVLYRSELRSDGARYAPVERIPLAGPEPAHYPMFQGEAHGEEHPIP